jgi:hypothetical protein
MAYNGNWINELEDTKPEGNEAKSLGDDALREIKRSLTSTFPNAATGDSYTGTFSQLNDLVAGATVPFNTIVMWIGDWNIVPDSWTICDGRARPGGGNAPDLRGSFPLGADAGFFQSGTWPTGATGGDSDIKVAFQKTNGHALTKTELPAHNHLSMHNAVGAGGTPSNNTQTLSTNRTGSGSDDYAIGPTANGASPANVGPSSSTGSNSAHTHDFNIDSSTAPGSANIPPYFALTFLIKD